MRYYPIGTFVTLKNGTHPVMIYGRKQMQEGTGYVWDYVACLYPEGYISDDYNIFFQQEEIDKVHRPGMYGFEETRMQQILNSMD